MNVVYRLNTYPLIHLGFLHALLNTLALVPLMERFEAEHGTLLTAAMFFGRELSTSLSEGSCWLTDVHQLCLRYLLGAIYWLSEEF